MHPTALAAARGKALEDMKSAALRLAAAYHLDPALVQGLEPTAKDPQVRDLQRIQGIAALLSAIPNDPKPEPEFASFTLTNELVGKDVTIESLTIGEDVIQNSEAITLTKLQPLPQPVIEPDPESVPEPRKRTRKNA
jgi:hypothetical protein